MMSYSWICHVCRHNNAQGSDVCAACSSPARLSAAQIEGYRSGVRQPAPKEVVSLDVAATLLEACRTLRVQGKSLFFALLLNVIATVLLEIAVSHFADTDNWLIAMALILVELVLFVLFAITCHRLVLLGRGSVPSYGLFVWGLRETRFAGWGALFFAMWIALFIPVAAGFFAICNSDDIRGFWLLLLIGTLPVVCLWARVCVLLPATAVGERRGIDWAWELTRGNGIRILFATWTIPAALAALNFGVEELLTSPLPAEITAIFSSLLYSVGAALDVIVLSLVYRFLTRNCSDAVGAGTSPSTS